MASVARVADTRLDRLIAALDRFARDMRAAAEAGARPRAVDVLFDLTGELRQLIEEAEAAQPEDALGLLAFAHELHEARSR